MTATTTWTIVGAAVQGSQHAVSGTPCQDAFGVFTSGERVVVCVADGAGSRPHSEVGAWSAVDGVRSWTVAGADGGVEKAFGAARVSVRTKAAQDRFDADDYACTLTVAVLHDNVWTVGQIGDGIAVVDAGDGPSSLTGGTTGEYVNETTFLTTLGAMPTVVTAPAGPLALSTDGLRMKVLADLRSGTPFAAFFEDVWAWAASGTATQEELAGFLEGLDDQTGDDKTLVVAVPPAALPS